MPNLTISEAARQWNVSRQTIYNRLNEGEISVSKDVHGVNQIDVAEMIRVFGEPPSESQIQAKAQAAKPDESATRSLASELQIERVKREAAEDMHSYAQEQIRLLQAKIERLERREDDRDKREEEREKRLLLAIENLSSRGKESVVSHGVSQNTQRPKRGIINWIMGIEN